MAYPRIVLVLTFVIAANAAAQNSVNGVMFLDRAARGEITLGTVRGSIGVIDYDRDGWYDLFIPDSPGRLDRLFHNVPAPGVPGGRSFADVTTGSGVDDPEGTARDAGSVVVFDYNNDGFPDIYTAGQLDSTSGLLYRNNGNGTFADVSVAAGVRLGGVFPQSVSACDFNHDGFSDLFIAAVGSPGKTLTLLVNNGNGTFTARADLIPSLSFTGSIYAHAWTDYDHDGWEDCLVCLNNGVPLTLRNVPNPSGGRMLVNATTASGFTSVGPAPMGIAVGDYDGDGFLDLAITDAVTGTYFRNQGGVFARVFPFTTFFGWGTTWLDADNDGRLDNYQAGSFGAANIDFLELNNPNGTWTEARAALNTPALASQQCARIDFDNDGREDIITVNPGQFVSVYHNQSARVNRWSKVRLIGDGLPGGVNRDAIGAVVRLVAGGRTQVREVIAGSSFSATEDPRAHFGLGTAAVIDRVEVVWPRAGTLAERTDVFTGPFQADTVLTLRPIGSCAADFDRSGGVTPLDVYAFLAAWFAGDASADINRDGTVALQDVFDFLAAWFGGCG